MFLSDRDLAFAVQTRQLIVDPPPTEFDTTSIDLHLDAIEEAKVWDVAAYEKQQKPSGVKALVSPGRFAHRDFSEKFCVKLKEDESQPVYRLGRAAVIKPGKFFLWQTQENVGTPEIDPRLICFIDGRSASARTGLVVHMTAPTIHAGWWGKVTLEIGNLGPFDLILNEYDAVCQLTVAVISSPPMKRKKAIGIEIGQSHVTGTGS